tara:strand:+ start:2636 stop:2782 length:147 start_codon:yes stop_codon:yes gene_type:complete
MNNEDKINELVKLLEHIKENLDTQCCQTLMDADSISLKIEQTLKELNL